MSCGVAEDLAELRLAVRGEAAPGSKLGRACLESEPDMEDASEVEGPLEGSCSELAGRSIRKSSSH